MTKIGWKLKYNLTELVKEMVPGNISLIIKELYIEQSGL
jgi:hypothetical protein